MTGRSRSLGLAEAPDDGQVLGQCQERAWQGRAAEDALGYTGEGRMRGETYTK